eukprot:ANDGO_06679.mRNA.1 Protein RER1B
MNNVLGALNLGISVPSGKTPTQHLISGLRTRFRRLLDRVHPYSTGRWIFLGVLFLAYILRVYLGGGWYVVTYGLGIYSLNLLVLFISPLHDPEVDANDDDGDEDLTLPLAGDDEHRPFIPKLPEFKFWYKLTRGVCIAFTLTLTKLTDIPVFWPILLLYFILLSFVTMKKRIQHMVKHRYLPFSYGKKLYGGKELPLATSTRGQ